MSVENNATKVDNSPDSLVEGLLGLVGGLVGGIVGEITSALPILENLSLGEVIKDLLTLKQESPDMFASGAFAGRVIGDVSIENCKVTNADVSNAKGMTAIPKAKQLMMDYLVLPEKLLLFYLHY